MKYLHIYKNFCYDYCHIIFYIINRYLFVHLQINCEFMIYYICTKFTYFDEYIIIYIII